MKITLVLLLANAYVVLSSPLEAGTRTAPVPALPSATAVKPKAAATSVANTVLNATASTDATSCAYARQREQNSNTRLPGRVIPECRPDGKYAALQCHGEAVGGGQFCQCWDPEGNIIRGPSKKVKACDCLLARHQATSERPRRIGAFVPACDDNGHFKKHQCHGSAGICWCAHPTNGTQIGEKVRGLAASSCA